MYKMSKVERKGETFQPVMITLETLAEFEAVYNAVSLAFRRAQDDSNEEEALRGILHGLESMGIAS